MAEEWCRDACKMADVEALSCVEIEKTLRAIKQEQHELTEKFKEAESSLKSAKSGLKNAKNQAEDQR